MLPSPSLKDLPRYPVTTGLAAAAIIVTGLWWSGQGIESMAMNAEVWTRWQLWRALTSCLPHLSVLHLLFNLYWLWKFGTSIERVFGHLECAGIYVLLGLGSSLAEFTLLAGGVGLSGIGYGLWGMLWVLEKRDARFTGAVDQQTSVLFVIWFFVCIVTTVLNVMPVANIAHGVGALMGVLLGRAISSRGIVRNGSVAGLAVVVGLGLAGSMFFWPWVNLSDYAEDEIERAGAERLEQNDPDGGVKLLKISTQLRHAPARAWYNLGIGYKQLKQFPESLAAFEHAARMPDADDEMKQVARDMKEYLTKLKDWRSWNWEIPASGVTRLSATNR